MRFPGKISFLPAQERPVKDEELIRLYRKTTDNTYLGHLFERYTHLVFGVCMKFFKNEEFSKDASMQIFENLIDDLQKKKKKNFKSWLYTYTRNYCLMELRKSKTREKHEQQYAEEKMNDFMESYNQMHHNSTGEKEERLQMLIKAIEELREEQKKCIKLMYLEEKSYMEISGITGYNMKQVKSYIQNGKVNLKKILTALHEKT